MPRRPCPRPRTILHIDDQPANLALVERVLETRPDLRLLSAADGRAGLALAREHRPDLILLDLHLPDIPGDEVIRRLHNEPRTRHIPVVVLSADADAGADRAAAPARRARIRHQAFKIQTLLQALDALLTPPAASGRRLSSARAPPDPPCLP